MIRLDYKLREDYQADKIDDNADAAFTKVLAKKPNPDPYLSSFSHFHILCFTEHIMDGTIDFEVDGEELYIGEVSSILETTMGLMRAINLIMLFKDQTVFPYMDRGGGLLFDLDPPNLKISYYWGGINRDVQNSVKADPIELFEKIGSFYTRIVRDLVCIHPKLAKNPYFIGNLPYQDILFPTMPRGGVTRKPR